MNFGQIHKLLTYLIAGLGLAGLGLGGELQGPSLVVAFVAFSLSAFAEAPLIERPAWIRSWNTVVVVALVVQVLRGVMGGSILSLGIEYAALLQVSRLFNRRAAAEHQQVAVLALLHLIATTVLTTELSYAFVFLGFVVVTPWMLVMSQLRFEGERGGNTELLSSRRFITGRFFVATGALTLPIFGVTLVLFFLFPRVGLGFIPSNQGNSVRRTGFGTEVELGDFGTIRTDPAVAMRFFVEEGASLPELLPMRFRGTSFDHYDGRKWERSGANRRKVSQYGGSFNLGRPGRYEDQQIRIELEHLSEPVLFVPDHTVALEVSPVVRRGRRVMRTITVGEGLDVRYSDSMQGIEYMAHVARDAAAVPEEPPDDDALDRYLELPEHYGDRSRLFRTALEIVEGARSPEEKALRIQRWLQDPKRFRYSLTLPEVGDGDPLNTFLFDKRFGHCEYFSTAHAIMLRAVSVPSRNVTGFLGGEYNSYGDYYVIRQGDAHSWVEIWNGETWVVFDPTPPAAMPKPSPWLTELRAIYDAVVSRWRRHVVGYDLSQQIALFRGAASWFRSGPRRIDEPDTPDKEGRGLGTVLQFLSHSWLPVLGVALLLALLLMWRSRRTRASGAERLVLALDRRLKTLGFPRPDSRTPLEQLAALREANFSDADPAAAVIERYLAARFGRRPLADGELKHWLRQAKGLQARRKS